MEGNNQFYQDLKAFNSILEKINSGDETVKLTKDERVRFTRHLSQNVKQMESQIEKSWFIKKWLMRSVYNQYKTLLENHFSD